MRQSIAENDEMIQGKFHDVPGEMFHDETIDDIVPLTTRSSIFVSYTILTCINHLIRSLLGTSEQTSSSGSNKTGLLTRDGASGDGRGLTNVLVVTTTMRVIDGVHGDTSGLGPRVSLGLVLVEGTTGLEQGLVDTTTTGDDTDDTSGVGRHHLLGTRGQLDSRLVFVGVVADDDDVVTRGSGESTTVTGLFFDVGDDGTFGARPQGQHVTDVQRRLLTGVDELAGVDTFVGNEGFFSQLVTVSVSEHDLGQGGASARVVDDLLDDTSFVTVSRHVRKGGELGSALSESGHGGENRPGPLSLVSDDSTHGG